MNKEIALNLGNAAEEWGIEITRTEIIALIKETDEEDKDFTKAKLQLYENFPRAPTEKDLKWLNALKGQDQKKELLNRFFSKPEQRVPKKRM